MTLYFFQLFGGVFLALVLTWWIGDYGIDGIVALWQRLLAFVQHHESRSPDGDGQDALTGGVGGGRIACSPQPLRLAGSEPADSHAVLQFDKTARYWAAVSMGRERR